MMSSTVGMTYLFSFGVATILTIGLFTGNWVLGAGLGLGSVLVLLLIFWVGNKYEDRKFTREQKAFLEHSSLHGWDIGDRFFFDLKMEVRDYVTKYPGVRTEELFTKFGDERKPELTASRFVDTMTHLGAYNIYRFGVTSEGLWFGYSANREVTKMINTYVNQMVKLYSFKTPNTMATIR